MALRNELYKLAGPSVATIELNNNISNLYQSIKKLLVKYALDGKHSITIIIVPTEETKQEFLDDISKGAPDYHTQPRNYYCEEVKFPDEFIITNAIASKPKNGYFSDINSNVVDAVVSNLKKDGLDVHHGDIKWRNVSGIRGCQFKIAWDM